MYRFLRVTLYSTDDIPGGELNHHHVIHGDHVLQLVEEGVAMMALYVEEKSTITNLAGSILDRGSLPKVTSKVIMLEGEMRSPINPNNMDNIGERSLIANSSFRKASR